MKRIAEIILRYRITILLFVLTITIFFGYKLKDLRIDNSVEGFVLDDDPDRLAFDDFKDTFGTDELIIICFEADNVFDAGVLSVVDEVTERLEDYKYIDEVISLTNAKEIRGSEGTFEVERLFKDAPESPDEIGALRDAVYDNPLFINYIIDGSERVTAIFAILTDDEIDESLKDEIVDDARAMLGDVVPDNLSYYVAGSPPVKRDMGNFLKRDQYTFTPITFMLMALILFLAFRSIKSTILPLVMVVITLIWALGFVAMMDRPITVVLSMLQPLIVVLTVAHVIHILSHYNENNLLISEKDVSLKRTVIHMLLPCFLTTITTAIGFSSLGVSKIPPIRDFGFFSAAGVLFAFIVVLTLIPIILSYVKPPKIREVGKREGGIIDKLLISLSHFIMRQKAGVIIVCIVLMVLSIIGILRIKVESDFIEYFKHNSDIYKSTFFVQQNLTGTSSLNIVVEGTEDGSIKDPRVLMEMEQLQKYLESKDQVRKAISIVDFLKDMNMAMHDDEPSYYVIPESRELVAQYLLLYSISGDPDDFERFVDFNYRKGTVAARLTHMTSRELQDFIIDTRGYCKDNFSEGLTVEVTGDTVLYANMSESLVNSQIKSILLALVTIFIVMSIVFRSLYLGALSMIPNVIPIFFTLGVMGWLGINLDTSTAMIGSVAIGIAVDDTIHFMTRYFRELSEGKDVEVVITNTLLNAGRPIIFTTFVIGAGFFVLLFGSFIPTRWFGILTAFTMFSALIGDLFVLPVVLSIARPKFKGWGRFFLDK